MPADPPRFRTSAGLLRPRSGVAIGGGLVAFAALLTLVAQMVGTFSWCG